MKIAVIGAGIAGLACAWRLAKAGQDVSLFEANDYFGGHSHTVDVTLEGQTFGVDTGFLVFNHHTYPQLTQLFRELDVHTTATDMSFSVKTPIALQFGNGLRNLEWAGANLNTVFAQRRNAFDPRFLRMLRDIVRFNRDATLLAQSDNPLKLAMSLGQYLHQYQYSAEFRDWYLLPMAGCIWSCATQQMLEFPVGTFIRFCHNHGLLQVSDRPQWQTVTGGSRNYVQKMLAGIGKHYVNTPVRSVQPYTLGTKQRMAVQTEDAVHLFDKVVLACHSDEALALLKDPCPLETKLLSAIRYQPNHAVLHTDASVLPHSRQAWSAWNYQSAAPSCNDPQVCVHYLLNRLQPLPFRTPVIVSLNPLGDIDPAKIIGSYEYAHPVFDLTAIHAQQQLGRIQGQRGIWFAGAWTGYGFHEDGLKSGLAVAAALIESQHNSRDRAEIAAFLANAATLSP